MRSMPKYFICKIGKQNKECFSVRFKWDKMGNISSIAFGKMFIKCYFHFQCLKFSYYLAVIVGSTFQEYLASLGIIK